MRISKNDEKWMANYEALKAYIDEHYHLPPKDAPLGAKYLLNWCKYVRKTIKEGTCDEWKREMFEGLMSERWMDEHTGGRKKTTRETESNENVLIDKLYLYCNGQNKYSGFKKHNLNGI